MPFPSRSEIISLLARSPSPVSVHAIAAELRVEAEKLPGLIRLLDDMVFSGETLATAGHAFILPTRKTWSNEPPPRQAPPSRKSLLSQEPPQEEEEPRAHKTKKGTAKSHQGAQSSHAQKFEKKFDKKSKGEPTRRSKFESATPQAKMPGYTSSDSRESKGAKDPNAPKGYTPSKNPAHIPENSRARFDVPSYGAGDLREGTISLHPRGFAFVSSQLHLGDDVYVEASGVGGAMHGDRVKVVMRRRGPRGPEGDVSEVLERAVVRVAGTLRRKKNSAWIEPDDARIRGPIPLLDDRDRVAAEGNSGVDGDAVVIRITRYPLFPGEAPEGKLENVLGRPGELRVEVQKLLIVGNVEENHSTEAFDEASAYGETVPVDMLKGREDLTHLPLPTIDPDDARDHDDAVWVERDGDGYRAWIAIADVSSYVVPNTKIDEEALQRGCSVYLPDRAIPMLPRPLSSNLCSLLPDQIRLCLCAEVMLDKEGVIVRTRLIRGFMKSQAKLTYSGVARALELSTEAKEDPKAIPYIPGLRIAYELSKKLRKRRMNRGAVDFEVPEAKMYFDEEGNVSDVRKRTEDPGVKLAYQLIEELMLLANEVVADFLLTREIPSIFRVHAPPDERKLEKFSAMAEILGVQFDADDAKDPKKLSALVRSFSDHPKAGILNQLLLRSMKQAAYDTVNIGHFGLASKGYTHFTSPIRRYPDLVVHRAVHRFLLKEGIDRSEDAQNALKTAAIRSSQNERRAMEVERDVSDLYKTHFMRKHIGKTFEGTIQSVVNNGAYVTLDVPFLDVMMRFEEQEGYSPSEDGLRLVSKRGGDVLSLGDRVMVEIVDASLARRTTVARRIGGENSEEDGGFSERPGNRLGDRSSRRGAGAYGSRGRSDKSGKGAGGKRTDARSGAAKGSTTGGGATSGPPKRGEKNVPKHKGKKGGKAKRSKGRR